MNWLQRVKRAIYPIASRYFSRAVLVEGILRGTDKPFQCLLVDNSSFMEYLLPRMFEGTISFKRKWKIWIPSVQKLVLSPPPGVDLCIAVLPAQYETELQGRYDYRSQEWVTQTLDVSASWEEIRKGFHKNPKETARKARKYGFTYKISNEERDFNLFYNSMYLPHLSKQFGKLFYVEPYEEVKKYFMKGFLLLVMEENQPIAGGICLIYGDTLTFRSLGVLNGDSDYIHRGAQSALYHFIIQYAKENRLMMVDLMKSRPFLNDCIYRHKQEWGATVSPDDESETWVYFFNLGAHEKLISFYENNPLIASAEGGLCGIVGWKGEDIASEEGKKELNKLFYAPGINGLKLLVDSSIEPVTYSFNSTTSASSTRQDTK